MLLLQALRVFVLEGKKYSDEGIIMIFWFEWLLSTLSVISLSFIRVVVGENKNFSSFAEKIMADAGVEVTLVQVMWRYRGSLYWLWSRTRAASRWWRTSLRITGRCGMKTSTRLSQIASVEYIKKPTHNGSQFTLMLLFISGQMIFLLSHDSEFWKKLQKEFWKGGEGL